MILDWFKSREAAGIGAALADEFASRALSSRKPSTSDDVPTAQEVALQDLLRRAATEVRSLRLNFYKRARIANSFKWRLIENGVDRETADRTTQALAVHLAIDGAGLAQPVQTDKKPNDQRGPKDVRQLLARGTLCMSQHNYADAIAVYEEVLLAVPEHAVALSNMGTAYSNLSQYRQAEDCFRRAAKRVPNDPEIYAQMGALLRLCGRHLEAEGWLRRAIKLSRGHVFARLNLGLLLVAMSRPQEGKAQFEKVLKVDSHNAVALSGLALVARTQSDLEESEALLNRALDLQPGLPSALALLGETRKMTLGDGPWLKRAEEAAVSTTISPSEQSDLHFSIGKYYDDIKVYKRAFHHFKLANDIRKSLADDYDREAHHRFVDELRRVFTRERVARLEPGASDSMKPVFVVGMPRSGTSLVEQIIASHPSARGAGEMAFWADTVRERGLAIAQGSIDESARRKLAEAYLSALERRAGDAPRIVDKATINSDYLGLIHSFFPKARMIYMQRDPIDSCLSCYFQNFLITLNFTMDLGDLAHYYREHHRLMAHWRAALPPGTVLDVPYAELIADQAGWTRKILDFIDLEWDDRCLEFHQTKRTVATASFWQVRQRIYGDSVARWRHYEKFIGPLLSLRDLDR